MLPIGIRIGRRGHRADPDMIRAACAARRPPAMLAVRVAAKPL
jgi:hypothetical protein